MQSGVTINLRERKKIRSFLDAIDPEIRGGVVDQALEAIAVLASTRAKRVEIIPGRGRDQVDAPPLDGKLSFRTGRLAASIAVDRSGAPTTYVVGTPVAYGPVHELGLRVSIPGHTRIRDGKPHKVKAHSVKFPRRPFLEPAAKFVIDTKAEGVFRKALERISGAA